VHVAVRRSHVNLPWRKVDIDQTFPVAETVMRALTRSAYCLLCTHKLDVRKPIRSYTLASQQSNRGQACYVTFSDFDDAAKAAPEIRESDVRDVDGQPADPEYGRGLARASPSRHRLLELLVDSARLHGVERLH
jgi:hypothetical protein